VPKIIDFLFKNKKINNLIYILFFFAVYCAIIIGEGWDESFHILQGKVILNYLFSFGNIDEKILYRENYSASYWSFAYLIIKMFPTDFQLQASHLVNTFFSILTIFGLRKLAGRLFNNEVGKLAFLILFFYPVFFGHMAINSKDTILAFSHIWITYYLYEYLLNLNKEEKSKYVWRIGILASIGTGIQMVFLGSLIPVIIFFLFFFIYSKKKKFKTKFLILDIVKCFIIFYLSLLFFWIDAYQNLIILPFRFLMSTLTDTYWTGWNYNLVNGKYYFSNDVDKSYLISNIFYKMPEYIIFLYLIFVLKFKNTFFLKKFQKYNYKIIFILLVLSFPNIIIFIAPYSIYDGLRLFLWVIPYICILPALILYYLIYSYKDFINKIYLFFLSVLFVFFLTDFFRLTPYQYTYLNLFNGKKDHLYHKFENDYWGTSLQELVKKSNFDKDKELSFSICGISETLSKKYLKKKYKKAAFVKLKDAKYIIMTNRTTGKIDNPKEKRELTNCFKKHKGNNLFEVKRNNQILSVIRELK
jgi:hypothetical protein